MKLIPAVDLRGGECVRLLRGDFGAKTVYDPDPLAVARRFAELAVADLHVVDLDGAQSGRQHHRQVVERIAAAVALDVQVGGGMRDRDTIAAWFDTGVRRCVLGSVAIDQPERVRDWLGEFGTDRLVLALDVRLADDGTPQLSSHGWQRTSSRSLWDALEYFGDCGNLHVLCTDIDRDGALSGPNTALYAQILERHPDVHLQASGGIRHIGDLQALRAARVPAAISGRALLDGAIAAEEIRQFRHDA